ncbi:MAG: glycosyltransferase, partial [Thermoguttaceae bacterium]
MKPRILQIISTTHDAGAGIQLRLLAQGLPGDQFDLHICALDGMTTSGTTGVPPVPSSTGSLPCATGVSTVLSSIGVPITVISKRWKYDPKTFWELKRLVDRLRPKAIHAWTSAANAYGLAAAKTTGLTRFVAGYGCVDPFISGTRLAIDRYIGKHCIQLTANSTGVRDFYIRKGLPAEKFRIIPGGVEPSRPSTTTRRQLMTELGLPENSRLIGLVGRLLLRN